MNLLVFSDTHLTKKFDEREFSFLKTIIEDADQIIINGDFWDGYLCSFNSFIDSEWRNLFPLLKKKNTVYLFGNHDQITFCDSRVNLFSNTQGDFFDVRIGKNSFHFEHGHRLMPSKDSKVKKGKLLKLAIKRGRNMERRLVRNFGTVSLQKMYRKSNNKIKNAYLHDISKHDTSVLVCGHTHVAELDLEKNYINSGIIGHGLGQYLVLDNDEILATEYWYWPPKIRSHLYPYRYLPRDYSTKLIA